MTTRTVNDPGLGTKVSGGSTRIINNNGQFNVKKEGQGFYLRDVFQYLVNMSWTRFLLLICTAFMVLNALVACMYVYVGIEGLKGATPGSFIHEFKQAFFFSVQTSATVGYGHMAPVSDACNVIAALETLAGLLALSIATGLFYGRFSRPRSSIVYSRNAIIAPYNGTSSLQFKIVNRRKDLLIDVEARVLLMLTETHNGVASRNYYQLKLEISSVAFMPLTWTIVHPISEDSPFYALKRDDLIPERAEVIIQIKAFDETFNQTIYSRHSYLGSELIWGAKFSPAFRQENDGNTVVFVDKIHDLELVEN